MYEGLKGKKLLVIGSAENDANIVRAAQEMGVYVIAADGTPQSSATFAKTIADEAWDVDYSDTEMMSRKCIEAGVQGVLAGYSEFRVAAACSIAQAIGTPFYATAEQIELTRSKRLFKDTCRKYGVRVPRDYTMTDLQQRDKIRFPIIVKPADAAGRKGITICHSADQLDEAIELALSQSVSKTLVVEEYVVGVEFAAIYTLQDGKSSLTCFNEKYLDQEMKGSGLCDLALTPSRRMEMYIAQADTPVRGFLQGIGAMNGVAFFQGIVTETEVYVFEMGYRLNGGNDYFIAERENGISYMKMLIAHSLTGRMEGDLSKDQPRFGKYYANFLLYAHGGRVGKIAFHGSTDREGLEDIHIKKAPGMVIRENGTTLQCAFTFKLSARTKAEMASLIRYCQENAELLDEAGNSMLFAPFDTSVLTDE